MFDASVPIKIFLVGLGESGKTTLLKSLFKCFSNKRKIKVFRKSTEEPTVGPMKDEKTSSIDKMFQPRTIGLDIYVQKVDEDLYLNVHDFGGQECFYSLHSIFLNTDDSFFFVIFNLNHSAEEIFKEMSDQLRIIFSHHTSEMSPNIVFLGTHLDQVHDTVKMRAKIGNVLHNIEKEFDLHNVQCHFIDATDPESKEMVKLSEITREYASRVLKNMVNIQLCFKDDRAFSLLHQELPQILVLCFP